MDETRVPLKMGTVLFTVDGRQFELLGHQATGGSAIVYKVRAESTALELCLKEYAPPGWVRRNGIIQNPAAGDEAAQQHLLDEARQEMLIS